MTAMRARRPNVAVHPVMVKELTPDVAATGVRVPACKAKAGFGNGTKAASVDWTGHCNLTGLQASVPGWMAAGGLHWVLPFMT